MSIGVIKSLWSGAASGSGITRFVVGYDESDPGRNAAAALTAVGGFWQAVKGSMPPGYTVKVHDEIDILNPSTGDLVGTDTGGGTGQTHVGIATGNFAAGVGLRIVWKTSGIVGNRKVKGSTFIVPLVAGCYDTDGSLIPGTVTTMATASGTLLTNLAAAKMPLHVWSRPVAGRPGQSSVVTGGTVPDKISWLRSRRT